MIQLKNILVATDFSAPSQVALDYGRNLARSYGAALHVLHVVEDVTMRYTAEVAFAIPDILNDMERRAERELNDTITTDDLRTLRNQGDPHFRGRATSTSAKTARST